MSKKASQPSVADEQPTPGGAAAVDRALSVLNAFSVSEPELTLADIAEKTRLYKSTILRLLASLEHASLVQRNSEGRYTLGPAVARMYETYSASFSVEAAILPAMRQLVERTRESASFHVRQGSQRLCLCRVDSPHPIRDHIKAGDLLPLDRGVGGRVLMAFAGAPGEMYERIREAKVVSLVGDRFEGVAGISAPVFGAGGKLAGAITLTMPSERFNLEYESAVKDTATLMSLALGAPALV
jgi:DNA-binding IclR family transcriptional regulator